ncbi:MAG TPA: hypothetical protein PKY82_35310 [Pyrinomonadaceae bacterium]|nr:hypothetical protein [Pyrinomonadaceae bacterium]
MRRILLSFFGVCWLIVSNNMLAAPVAFNEKAKVFNGKVIVAKTFATWCAYCRKEAIAEAQAQKEGKFHPTNEQVVFVILVTADDFDKSVSFFKQIGLEKNIQVASEKQLGTWKIVYYPTTLIFKGASLKKMFPGEVTFEEVWKEVERQLPKGESGQARTQGVTEDE